jgi:hypothetical protein
MFAVRIENELGQVSVSPSHKRKASLELAFGLGETFNPLIRFSRVTTYGERQKCHVVTRDASDTLSNVVLKIHPKVRAELLSRATTITQPDAINSTEANQTSPIVCEVKLRADVWADGGYYYREDHCQWNARIVAAKPPTSASESYLPGPHLSSRINREFLISPVTSFSTCKIFRQPSALHLAGGISGEVLKPISSDSRRPARII